MKGGNMMFDKKARFASVLFMFVIVLPLLGLMIMDYQLKKANDITGAYLVSPMEAYASEFSTALFVIAVFGVGSLLVFGLGKMRKSQIITTAPLERINEDISDIEKKLEER